MKFQKNISLKNQTTFRIGGKAKYFFVARTRKDLILAINKAKEFKLPFFVLGGGSNLLISDKGYKGLVIKIQNTKYQILNTKVVAEAGLSLGKLVNISAEKGLTGIEWSAGIPGTVGGAIYGNAGAFKKSMRDVIESVEVLDVKKLKTELTFMPANRRDKSLLHPSLRLGQVAKRTKSSSPFKFFKNKNCKFGYRDSIFKKKKNLIILSTTLRLKKGKKNKIKQKIKEHLSYKKKTHPLNLPSAGSIFKNFTPYRNKIYGAGPKELKEFKEKGMIPAARLIEKCGLKGKRIGGAKISEKHANFIVNLEGAQAKDVKKLISLIRKKVKNKFGIVLKEEIQFLGF